MKNIMKEISETIDVYSYAITYWLNGTAWDDALYTATILVKGFK